jgi:SSS family solute:sodium (Na+) symporter
MFPNADWAIFPLTSPGLVSIPLSFFVGWFVSIVTKPDNLDELAAEMEVRSLTGVGVEAPVQH